MIIVGSGPAGLTAAYLAAKRGHKVEVIEAGRELGGMWRGVVLDGLYFERGMQWYCDSGVREIDDFWRTLLLPSEMTHIDRERAGCEFLGQRQLYSPHPDCRGTTGGAMNALAINSPACPILKKIYGTADIVPGKRIVPIDRVICAEEDITEYAMQQHPYLASRLAWPDQQTLPGKYHSGRASFYPKQGMRHLVSKAVERLKEMGVLFRTETVPSLDGDDKIFWAAGLHSAAQAFGIKWDATPARRVTMAAVTTAFEEDDGEPSVIHYAYDYTPTSELFRTTWYDAVIPGDNRVTAEYIERTVENIEEYWAGKFSDRVRLHGVVDLGPCIPVPTAHNELAFECVRMDLHSRGIRVIGAGSLPGAFFQRDWQPHIKEIVDGL